MTSQCSPTHACADSCLFQNQRQRLSCLLPFGCQPPVQDLPDSGTCSDKDNRKMLFTIMSHSTLIAFKVTMCRYIFAGTCAFV